MEQELHEHFNSLLAQDGWSDEDMALQLIDASDVFENGVKSAFVPHLARLIAASRKMQSEDRVHWMRLELNRTEASLEALTNYKFTKNERLNVTPWLNKCLLQFDPNPHATDDPMLLATATGKLPPMKETLEELIRN